MLARKGRPVAQLEFFGLDARPQLDELQRIAPARVGRGPDGAMRAWPDLANFMPSRLISLEEARLAGWPAYYDATPCARGHVSPRWVANHACVDCRREQQGRSLIGIQLGTPETSVDNTSGDAAQTFEVT